MKKMIICILMVFIISLAHTQTKNIDPSKMSFEELTQKIEAETDTEMTAIYYSIRAVMYAEKYNDINKAMKDIDKAIELYPHGMFYAHKGSFYIALEDYKHCIEYIDKAISLNIETSDIYAIKGYALTELMKYKEAIEAFSMAIKIEPAVPIFYFYRGIIYKKINNFESAYSDFAKANELDPKLYDAAYMAGDSAFNLGRYDKAIRFMNIALDSGNPEYVTAYYIKAFSNFILGNLKEVERNSNEYLKYRTEAYSKDNEMNAYILRAFAYTKFNKLQLAEQDMNKVIEIHPNEAIPYLIRCVLYLKLSKNSLSINDANKYMALAIADRKKCLALNKEIKTPELIKNTTDLSVTNDIINSIEENIKLLIEKIR